MRRVLLSWSSGKDSAWSLRVLRQQPNVEVVGLLTTFNEIAERVSMHAVRRSLVEAQAAAAHLPLWQVPLPFPCSNAEYEDSMRVVIGRAREEGVTHMAFGDLFLEDVREYRIRMLSKSGIEPLFPLWCSAADTPALARTYDAALLSDLPPAVDPCGERGEFHTFCFAGPMFASEIDVRIGEIVLRDGFCFAELMPRI